MNWLARLTLLAYPRSFRRSFGPDYLRTVADLRNHGRHNNARVAQRLLTDALTTAPAMRWEHLMNSAKLVLTVIAAVAAAFGILLGAPIVAFPMLAVFAALALGARHHDQPIATEAADWGRRWYLWLATAAGLFLLGFAMLLTEEDGGLSSVAWAVWILSWLAAAIVAAVGLGLGATRVISQRRA